MPCLPWNRIGMYTTSAITPKADAHPGGFQTCAEHTTVSDYARHVHRRSWCIRFLAPRDRGLVVGGMCFTRRVSTEMVSPRWLACPNELIRTEDQSSASQYTYTSLDPESPNSSQILSHPRCGSVTLERPSAVQRMCEPQAMPGVSIQAPSPPFR